MELSVFYIKELTCPPKSHFHLQTQHVMDPQKMDHNRHHLKRSCHQDHVIRDHFEQDKLKSNFLNLLLEIIDLNIIPDFVKSVYMGTIKKA